MPGTVTLQNLYNYKFIIILFKYMPGTVTLLFVYSQSLLLFTKKQTQIYIYICTCFFLKVFLKLTPTTLKKKKKKKKKHYYLVFSFSVLRWCSNSLCIRVITGFFIFLILLSYYYCCTFYNCYHFLSLAPAVWSSFLDPQQEMFL